VGAASSAACKTNTTINIDTGHVHASACQHVGVQQSRHIKHCLGSIFKWQDLGSTNEFRYVTGDVRPVVLVVLRPGLQAHLHTNNITPSNITLC
jgi:hypothetical protein